MSPPVPRDPRDTARQAKGLSPLGIPLHEGGLWAGGATGSTQHRGDGTLQRQVLARDRLQRGGVWPPAACYVSLSHDLQKAGVPVPPLTPETPGPCPHPPGPLHRTLEHISCRALAMPLAGTLQWKT